MTHVGEEFRFGPVGKLCNLSSLRVFLNAVAKTRNHEIDLAFQLVHLSRSSNRNLLREITKIGSVSDAGKCSNLGC